jgi:RimJ/RimL family protein N-acetyltransferase
VAGLLRLLVEVEAEDGEGGVLTEAELSEQLGWSFHEPERDRWVVEVPDRADTLAAHGVVWKLERNPRAELDVGVHPKWRRRGLGTEVLSRLLGRARELGAEAVALYPNARNTAAREFAHKHGFGHLGLWTEMLAPGNTPLPEPVWPEGYTARSYDAVRQRSLLLEATNRSFRGQVRHSESTEEELASWLEGPSFRQDGVFLAFAPDSDVAGVCRASVSEELSARRGRPTGYVDAPGVVPEHRHVELRLPLLLCAMRWLRENGGEVFELGSWGDSEEQSDQPGLGE